MSIGRNEGIFTLKEFKNRGVIKLAPDVLLYIGGGMTLSVVSPVTNKEGTLSFADGITNVSIQNSIQPGASTANIEISTPIYGEKSKYWVYYPGLDAGTPTRASVFLPMMEVKIYFKGRFMVNTSNGPPQPQYYPAFWGFISHVEENYSGGLYKITLNCVDILHWWAYSKINVHPVPESNIAAGGGQTLTVWGTIFKKQNPFDIIYTLTTFMGMHEFVTPTWVAQMTSLSSQYPRDQFKIDVTGIMAYWRQRFSTISNNLKMYGVFGTPITASGVEKRLPNNNTVTKNKTNTPSLQASASKATNTYNLDKEFLRKFTPLADLDQLGEWETAEYMTKLEIATEIKNRCEYEFFQDTNGNFIFKPPFYNLNVKGIQPYHIKPNDIINFSSAVDSEGIVTVINVNLPFFYLLKGPDYPLKRGYHMDIDLCKKYGVRYQEIPVNYINDAKLAQSVALGQMNLINSKCVTGSITLPGRPEMRLGYPIYMEHRDSYAYVTAINHSFDYGGSFTTTLSLETERRKVYNFGNLTDPDQVSTGSWTDVLKDKVFRLKSAEDAALKAETSKKVDPYDPPNIYTLDTTQKKVQDKLTSENSIYSLNQGKYVVSDRKAIVRTEGGKEQKPDVDAEKTITEITVPFTDEDGYRLVGGFPYGRDLNPICIDDQSPTKAGFNRKTFITTMMKAGPAYSTEADAMNNLFFFGDTNAGKPAQKEGSVPAYAKFDSLLSAPGTMPSILGAIGPQMTEQTTADSQGSSKKAQKALQKKSTVGAAQQSSQMTSRIREVPISGALVGQAQDTVKTTKQSSTMDP